jgi:hypothetical protein
MELTMRLTPLIIAVLFTLTLSLGCGKKAEAPTTPAPTAAAEATQAADKPAVEAAAKPAEAAKEAPKSAEAAPTGDKPAPAAGGEKIEEPDAPQKQEPQLSADECQKACAHATALSMKSLPPDANEETRTAIKKALDEKCPQQCREKGTKAMVQCILAAKSGMDLAACPK